MRPEIANRKRYGRLKVCVERRRVVVHANAMAVLIGALTPDGGAFRVPQSLVGVDLAAAHLDIAAAHLCVDRLIVVECAADLPSAP